MKNLKKTLPLSLALVMAIGLTGCADAIRNADGPSTSSPTSITSVPDEAQGQKMSKEVSENISQTMLVFAVLASNSNFMEQVMSVGSGQGEFEGVEKQLETIDELVADGETMKSVMASAAESLGVEDSEGKHAELLAKTSPLGIFSYAHGVLSSPATNVEIDEDSFELRDGVWYPVKDGAIALLDTEGRYTTLSNVGDNLSFTESGEQISLAAIAQGIEVSQSELTRDVEAAVNAASGWMSDNSIDDAAKVAENASEFLKGVEFSEGTTVKFEGTETGFIATATNNDKSVSYDSTANTIAAPEMITRGETTAFTLYHEFDSGYVDALLGGLTSGSDDSRATLEAMAGNLNKAEDGSGAEWSVKGEGEQSYPVATLDGKEYAFQTPDYSMPDGSEGSEDAEGIEMEAPEDEGPVG